MVGPRPVAALFFSHEGRTAASTTDPTNAIHWTGASVFEGNTIEHPQHSLTHQGLFFASGCRPLTPRQALTRQTSLPFPI